MGIDRRVVDGVWARSARGCSPSRRSVSTLSTWSEGRFLTVDRAPAGWCVACSVDGMSCRPGHQPRAGRPPKPDRDPVRAQTRWPATQYRRPRPRNPDSATVRAAGRTRDWPATYALIVAVHLPPSLDPDGRSGLGQPTRGMRRKIVLKNVSPVTGGRAPTHDRAHPGPLQHQMRSTTDEH
jgi:hypothetical protein